MIVTNINTSGSAGGILHLADPQKRFDEAANGH